jgi:hypothetical protein
VLYMSLQLKYWGVGGGEEAGLEGEPAEVTGVKV